jgi:hypothetical protein
MHKTLGRIGSVVLVSGLALGAVQVSRSETARAQSINGLHVVGNQLATASGTPVILRGADHSGSEYACAQGWGIFDGPVDQASITAMKSWGINAVRIPLNEDCWLNINGVSASVSGAAYQSAITNYVNLLTQNGMYSILDLHWNAPGSILSLHQQPMADQDHAPDFWTGVANAFKNDGNAIFDLYNEPHPDWACWRDGCQITGNDNVGTYQAAGMQTLVNTVRATGATNLILLGGISYGGQIDQWMTYKPNDPLNNLAAGMHSYGGIGNIQSHCNTIACFDSEVAPVALKYPVIEGEVGDVGGGGSYLPMIATWDDQHGVSYLAWRWNTSAGSEALISNTDGTPTSPYGQSYKTQLASAPPPVAPTSTPPSTATTAATATTPPSTATATTPPSTATAIATATKPVSTATAIATATRPISTATATATAPPPTVFQSQTLAIGNLVTNRGISNDNKMKSANYDHDGYSYSANAMAAGGFAPSATLRVAGIPFDWSGANAGVRDNVVAGGQVIPVSGAAGATELALLGSATNGPSSGTLSVTYTDGTVQHSTLGMDDWTLNDNQSALAYGNTVALNMSYRNHGGYAAQPVHTYVFLSVIPLLAGKNVSSIALPASVNQGMLHVFAATLTNASGSAPTGAALTVSATTAGSTTAVSPLVVSGDGASTRHARSMARTIGSWFTWNWYSVL